MPGPLDALKKAQSMKPDTYSQWFSEHPIIGGIANAIAPVDPHPEASWGPVDAMTTALPMAGGVLKGLEALKGARPVSLEGSMIHPLTSSQERAMERMYQQANPTFRRLESEGMFGGDRTAGGIGRTYRPPTADHPINNMSGSYHPAGESLGESNPFFTAVGGEDMFNVGRPKLEPLNSIDAIYNSILRKGGR